MLTDGTGDGRRAQRLINHSSLYGKYEEDIDRESAYERLQQGVQASTEQQNTPPANGKAVDVDGGILGGLKDILFGSTGPRGGKRDGVVQSVAKSAARQGYQSDNPRHVGEFDGREKTLAPCYVADGGVNALSGLRAGVG